MRNRENLKRVRFCLDIGLRIRFCLNIVLRIRFQLRIILRRVRMCLSIQNRESLGPSFFTTKVEEKDLIQLLEYRRE